ncbi:alpha/beta hydrolase [Gordonia phthalatica]|uniref:alpha/beta hydrolase n=1 Tax=Gordonia phthalatica TaxID=1136941 RepID=UPI000AC46C61|nr:alpha/beta hydrolase [Gordonia phthalatica]
MARRFHLNDVPGILWTPACASPSNPVPLVIAGQPGGIGMQAMHPRLAARAHAAARSGYATATLELPGAGERPRLPAVEEAGARLRHAFATDKPITADITDQLVLPLVDAAAPECSALLDELLDLPECNGIAGYAGGMIALAVRVAVTEPRIRAAVLFAGSVIPQSTFVEARDVTIPLHALLQWDDEHNDRQAALDLFDAFASTEKTLTANMGGHTGVPASAGAAADEFLVRHLAG